MKPPSAPVAILGIVIAIAVIGGTLYFLFRGETNQTTTISTSTTQVVSPEVKSAFDTHLTRIGSRDVSLVLTDYEDNAVVLWVGQTQGLGGIYSGTDKIRLLYANALSGAKSITVTSSAYSQINGSTTQASVSSTLSIRGTSSYLGKFNGTIDAQLTYKSDNGAWKISNENWDYKILNITVAGGATTFPEWQKVGPIDASRRSLDWLHNFAWDYGGPGLAVLVWGYVFIIAALIMAKSVRKPSE